MSTPLDGIAGADTAVMDAAAAQIEFGLFGTVNGVAPAQLLSQSTSVTTSPFTSQVLGQSIPIVIGSGPVPGVPVYGAQKVITSVYLGTVDPSSTGSEPSAGGSPPSSGGDDFPSAVRITLEHMIFTQSTGSASIPASPSPNPWYDADAHNVSVPQNNGSTTHMGFGWNSTSLSPLYSVQRKLSDDSWASTFGIASGLPALDSGASQDFAYGAVADLVFPTFDASGTTLGIGYYGEHIDSTQRWQTPLPPSRTPLDYGVGGGMLAYSFDVSWRDSLITALQVFDLSGVSIVVGGRTYHASSIEIEGAVRSTVTGLNRTYYSHVGQTTVESDDFVFAFGIPSFDDPSGMGQVHIVCTP